MTESFSVVNHADGTMTITARIRSPAPPIVPFVVQGPEAVKRYRKWIVLTATGLLTPVIPELMRVTLRYVETLGPDSDGADA